MTDPTSFIRRLANVRLTDGERQQIAAGIGIRVRKGVDNRPERRMSTEAFIRRLKQSTLTPVERAQALEYIHTIVSQKLNRRWMMMKRILSGCLAGIILIVSGGITATYAAQESLPGETLYTWKVRVAEPLVGFIRMTNKSRATWAIERADRRLHETAMLMKRHALTPEERTMMHEQFKKHATEAQVFMDRLEKENMTGAMEIGDAIEDRLHKRSMEMSDAEGDDGPQDEMNPFFDDIIHTRKQLGRLAVKNMKPVPREGMERTERPGPAVMMMSAPVMGKHRGEDRVHMKREHRRMPTREELRKEYKE